MDRLDPAALATDLLKVLGDGRCEGENRQALASGPSR